MDEHFTPEIARQLRAQRGHDVRAVSDNPQLEALSDANLLAYATSVDSVLVTENVVDFMPLHTQLLGSGGHHGGLIFTNPRHFPRSRHAYGRLIDALDEYLQHVDAGTDLNDSVHWL